MIFGESRVDIARRIVERHQAEEIDGVLVDAFSASAYIQIYDALARPENRAQMERYEFPFVMDRVVWPIVQKTQGGLIMVGTVIHGTLRLEDLIPAFIVALNTRLDEESYGDLLTDSELGALTECAVAIREIEAGMKQSDYFQSEEAQFDFEQLMDLLNRHAPDGTYFGTLEGDGTDFGFWQQGEA